MRLQGKVCLVTGGTRGIGKGIANEFLKEGATIFLTYASNEIEAETTLRDFDQLYPGKIQVFRADVRERVQLLRVFQTIQQKNGGLDVLVNNAGVNKPTDFDQVTDQDWDEILSINLKGPFICSQMALDYMNRGGSIVKTVS